MTDTRDYILREVAQYSSGWNSSEWFDYLQTNFKCLKCGAGLSRHAWYPYRRDMAMVGSRSNGDAAIDYGVCPGNGGFEWSRNFYCPKSEDAPVLAQVLLAYSKSPEGQRHHARGFIARTDNDNNKRDLLYDLMTRPAKYQIPMDSHMGVCTDYD